MMAEAVTLTANAPAGVDRVRQARAPIIMERTSQSPGRNSKVGCSMSWSDTSGVK
jgi:hypothetical protein